MNELDLEEVALTEDEKAELEAQSDDLQLEEVELSEEERAKLGIVEEGVLPDPTADMYDQVGSYEEAQALYEEYRNSPNTSRREDFNVGEEDQNIIEKGIGYVADKMPFTYDTYTNPKTGKTSYLLPPRADTFATNIPVVGAAIQGVMDEVAPDFLAEEKVDTSPEDKLAAGLATAGANVVEAGAAVVDTVAGTNTVDAVQKAVPTTSSGESGILSSDFLLVDMVPTVAAFIGGGSIGVAANTGKVGAKIAEYSPKIANILNTAFKTISGGLAGETAVAATSSSDTGTLAIGENSLASELLDENNSMAQLLRGVSGGDSEAGKILAARSNIILDAYLSLGILSGAGELARVPGRFVANSILIPAYKGFMRGEEAVMRDVAIAIADAVSDIGVTTTSAELSAARENLVQILLANKDVTIEMGNLDPIQFTVDSMSAIGRSEVDGPTKQLARNELRAGLTKGSPNLATKVDEPVRQLNQYVDQTEAALGGEEAIAGAGEVIFDKAKSRMDVADAATVDMQTELLQAEQTAMLALKANPELAARVSKMTEGGALGATGPKDAARTSIVNDLEASKTAMDKIKDDKFNDIPSGLNFDAVGFAESIAEAVRSANVLDPSGKSVMQNQLIQTIRSAIRKASSTADESQKIAADVSRMLVKSGVNPEDIELDVETLAEILKSKGVDFKVLYNQVRPQISKLASESFNAGNAAAGVRLRQIVHGIDGQIETLPDLNGGQIVPQVTEAMRYYTDEYAPVWRDGVLREVGDLYGTTIGRTSKRAPDGSTQFNVVDWKDGTNRLIDDVFSGDAGRSASADQLVDLLKYGQENQFANADNAYDYLMSDFVLSIYNKASGLTDEAIRPEELTAKLQQIGRVLKDNFPEKANEFNAFFEGLTKATSNKDTLIQELKKAEVNATAIKKDIMTSELRYFVEKLGNKFDPNAPYASFKTLFNGDNAVRETEALMAKAGDSVAVLQGMKAAWHKNFREKMLRLPSNVDEVKAPNMRAGERETENYTFLEDVGRVVFADEPELIEVTRQLLDEAVRQRKNVTGQPIAGQSPTAYNQAVSKQAAGAISSIIKFTIGPLDALGTKIGTVSTNVIKAINPDENVAAAHDILMSNPDLLIKYIREGNTSDASIRELASSISSGVIRSLIYRDENNEAQEMVAGAGDEQVGQDALFTKVFDNIYNSLKQAADSALRSISQ